MAKSLNQRLFFYYATSLQKIPQNQNSFFLKFLLDDFLIVSDKRGRFVSIVLILYTIKTLLNRRDQHIVSCTHRTLESTQTSCHRKSLISPLVFSGVFFQLLKARKSINVIH